MQTTKTLFSKTLLSMALIGLSGIAFANVDSAENLNNDSNASISKGMKALLKEAGGSGYVDRNVYQKASTGNDGDNSTGYETVPLNQNHDKHLKEHGGQIYQSTKFDNAWTVDEDGHGALGSKLKP